MQSIKNLLMTNSYSLLSNSNKNMLIKYLGQIQAISAMCMNISWANEIKFLIAWHEIKY